MRVSSNSFENNKPVPVKYTCDGEDVSPHLAFLDVPQNAKSLAIIMDDPDASGGTFVHWVVCNITPNKKEFSEGENLGDTPAGKNDFGKSGYGGPCPPSGTHRYIFKLYALDSMMDNLQDGSSTKSDLEDAMQDHIIDKAELVGTYSR